MKRKDIRTRVVLAVLAMTRRLVGTLVEVGRGTLDDARVAKLLAEQSAAPAKWTALPSGLFLERVES